MIDFAVTAATIAGFFAILAAGLNIQWGLSGMANFGLAGFFALGAYVTGMGMVAPVQGSAINTNTYLFSWGLPWPAAAAAALAVTAVAALVIARALMRTRLEPLFVAVITLAFSEVLIMLLTTEKWLANGFSGVIGIEQPLLSKVGFDNYDVFYMVVVLAIAAIVVALTRYLQSTPFGRLLKGIREEPEVVQSFGHDVRKARRTAFVIGCMIMALAGALWAPYATVVEPSAFKTEETFLIWAVLIIGGSANAYGPLVGAALVIGLIQQGTRFLPASGEWANLVPSLRGVLIGVLFMVLIRFRPEGIAAERPRRIVPAERGKRTAEEAR